MKLKALLSLAILATSAYAHAEWVNPQDKYKNEYKNHIEAKCPAADPAMKNFVYFARDRKSIRDHIFLDLEGFDGAQIMYPWRELEPEKGHYDFSRIESDLKFLEGKGKKLFIQLQDATFRAKYKAVPDYLLSEDFDGGVAAKWTDSGEIEGWVAKRWNDNVQERFAKLLLELGKAFDGRIEGINLQETAIDVSHEKADSFNNAEYVLSLKENMLALGKAFPISTKLQYANFTPGEWLPWEDKGQLKSIYEYGEKIGVGLGAPDLMVQRRGQLNHPISMMHESTYTVPLGIAVQDGNYIGKTNNDDVVSGRKNIVPMLYSFADNFLRVDYIFWSNQKPYFAQDVASCIK